MKKISIIIPVYNASRYLRQTLDSVCFQSLEDIEIICVDDGSMDDSISILNEYAENDKRIVLLSNPLDTDGAAEARNIGLRAASGKYIAFLDADDYAESGMLEEAYKKAEETSADIVMFGAWYQDEQSGKDYSSRDPLNPDFLPKEEVFSPKDYSDAIFRMTHGAVWGRLFRKSFIDEKNLEFFSCHYWDDIEFVYTALCEAEQIAVLNQKLLHYRWNAIGNQSGSVSKHPEIGYKATYELRRRFEERGLMPYFKEPLINCLVGRAFSILERMTDTKGFNELFYKLKDSYLEKLGAYEIEDGEYESRKTLMYRQLMDDSDNAEDFLMRLLSYDRQNKQIFLNRLQESGLNEGKIAIYGAGKIGVEIFDFLMDCSIYHIVAWVDKRFEEIGFPVQSPETLANIEFDIVVVAIESDIVSRKVSQWLISIGVSGERIITY